MPRFFGKQKDRLIQMNVENKRLIKKLRLIQLKSGIESGKLIRATTFEVLGRVIKKTPVDTGRARAAWTPYLNDKGAAVPLSGGTPEGVGKGEKEGTYNERLRGFDRRIIVVNNVPYIVQLEFGSSKQAPGGMVREAMREVASGLDEALKKYARKIRK